jgi:crotonyl-CoA reductase
VGGAFTYLTVVRENQLLPKPEHLTWEEAASLPLVASTAYRMLVSKHGAQMKQGDNVLVWGASGGLGALGIQFVLNGGGFPIGVVSSPAKAEIVRKMGCPAVIVIDHHAGKGQFIDENGKMNIRQMYRLRINIRQLTGGEDCNIVFEHTGRSTFAASVFVAKNGGKIVTCGSTSGYEHVFDNRYLWQRIKTIIGTHGANYNEAMEASRLVSKGKIHPIISKVFPLSEVKEAAYQIHRCLHVGKLGILCLSPEEGLGIRNRELREEIGEEKLNVFRGDLASAAVAN